MEAIGIMIIIEKRLTRLLYILHRSGEDILLINEYELAQKREEIIFKRFYKILEQFDFYFKIISNELNIVYNKDINTYKYNIKRINEKIEACFVKIEYYKILYIETLREEMGFLLPLITDLEFKLSDFKKEIDDYIPNWNDFTPQQTETNTKQTETLNDLITHKNSIEIIESVKIQYRNIKGKRLKLLLIAFQDLGLLPKERIAKKFHECCLIEFDWDIASYNAMNGYNYNEKTDKDELNSMKKYLETLTKQK
jgi:hypothetical protein